MLLDCTDQLQRLVHGDKSCPYGGIVQELAENETQDECSKEKCGAMETREGNNETRRDSAE